MSAEATPDERTEAPTPKRIKEFRDRGEVAKSQELASVAVLCAGMAILWVTAPRTVMRLSEVATRRLQYAWQGDIDIATMQRIAFSSVGAGVRTT